MLSLDPPAPEGSLLEKAVATFISRRPATHSDVPVAVDFNDYFNIMGPYHAAKAFNALVDNSGEELAVQWMTYWNKHHASGHNRY